MNEIPNDWDGETTSLVMVCVPNSPLWHRALRTAVRALTRGRYWDFESGNFLQIQQTAWEVYDSMAICDDLIFEVRNLVSAVQQISVDNQTIINQQQGCCWINDNNDAVENEVPPMPGVPPDEGNPPPQSEPDWATRRCYGGYAYINLLLINLTKMMDLFTAGIVGISAILGMFLLGLGLLTTAGAIAVVGGLASQAVAVWSAWRDLADTTFLDPVKATLESDTAVRARIACAFKNAVSQETLRDEVMLELEAQFGSLAAGLLVNLVLESQMQAFYNGQYQDANGDTQILDFSPIAAQNPDCACLFDVLIGESFDADTGNLTLHRAAWSSDYGGTARLTANDVDVGALRVDNAARGAYGLPSGKISNLKISLTARSRAGESGETGLIIRVHVVGQGVTEVLNVPAASISDLQSESYALDLTGTDVTFSGGGINYIEIISTSTGGSRSLQIDDLIIRGDVT